jgi:hypothetical protein
VQAYSKEKQLQEAVTDQSNFQWERNVFIDMSINILSSSNEENKNVHSVEKESLKQNISAILYFKQIEKMLSYDRVFLTGGFLRLSSSQCLGNTICLRLTAGG